jgi:hypothetical protein
MGQVAKNVQKEHGQDVWTGLLRLPSEFRDYLGEACPRLSRPLERRPAAMYFIRDGGDVVKDAREALAGGHTVELVTGPMLKDRETRQALADLVKVHGVGRLSIYSCQLRPFGNATLMNGNIVYEHPSEYGAGHGDITAIRRADQKDIEKFREGFAILQRSAALKTTPNEILRMPLVQE